MSKNIDTVIFDLGGVLIDWNPEYVFRQVFEEEEEMRYFFEEVCTSEWNLQQDAGRPLKEATEEKVREFPEYEAAIRAYYGRWENMLGGAIQETVRILEQIHARGAHRLYALTNWSHETFPVAQERFGFLQLFEGIVVSGQEKLAKPDHKIYHTLLNRYQARADASVFIDDNAHNVEAAKEVGLQAIHFQGAEPLKEELMGLGVL
ncbi:MAG: HAD family phosphatase [Phaeodactylibacter sp.]|nr:HAD family phosphatase [Phaeodactylibacter sp.]MCB9265797.1 HAD family phosphatase [Lewinellaceae bacterium]MCB9290970.1 HAD family phosphatase [Lewinellaceae bacterium]